MSRFAKGDRVRMSQKGFDQGLYLRTARDRLGTVLKGDELPVVRWDGNKGGSRIHWTFIELANRPLPQEIVPQPTPSFGPVPRVKGYFHTQETIAAICSLKGRAPASAIGQRFGLSRNAVVGIWHRHFPTSHV
jgi:hypothetical protein